LETRNAILTQKTETQGKWIRKPRLEVRGRWPLTASISITTPAQLPAAPSALESSPLISCMCLINCSSRFHPEVFSKFYHWKCTKVSSCLRIASRSGSLEKQNRPLQPPNAARMPNSHPTLSPSFE
jgi:hypothetical protein